MNCQGQPALPVGQSDLPRMHTTKIFCCRCEDIYYPRSSRQANVDGAYFGTTFCHLFLQTYWEMKPKAVDQVYTPRIFGFKIHRPEGQTRHHVNGGGGSGGGAAEASAAAERGRSTSLRDGTQAVEPRSLPPPRAPSSRGAKLPSSP